MPDAGTGPFLGALAALGCAAIWAYTICLYRPVVLRFGPRAPNLFKCAFGAVLYLVTILWMTGGRPLSAYAGLATGDLMLLVLSGVLGLAVSDTALFWALRRIGAQKSLLLQCTSPLFAAGIAFAWQGERMTPLQIGAAALTVMGVALVISDAPRVAPADRRGQWLGVAVAVLAALTQALGLLTQRPARAVLGEMPLCLVRTAAATVVLGAGMLLTGGSGRLRALAGDRSAVLRTSAAALLGTYLGLAMMAFAIGNAPAGIVAALLSTTPVFLLPLGTFLYHEHHGRAAVVGTVVAVAGIVLLVNPRLAG
jgi:drug/metabolite transporter (DMT)-like permease